MRSTERRCKCRHSPRCEDDCCGSRLASCLGFVAFFALFVYPLILFLRWWLRQQRQQVPPPPRFAAPTSSDCQTIPPHIYRRPDPMIYSQQYLQSQGIAVTWQNPDVTIEQGGVPVDPTQLQPCDDLRRRRADLERFASRRRSRHAGAVLVSQLRRRHPAASDRDDAGEPGRERSAELPHIRDAKLDDAGDARPLLPAGRARLGRRRESEQQHRAEQHRRQEAELSARRIRVRSGKPGRRPASSAVRRRQLRAAATSELRRPAAGKVPGSERHGDQGASGRRTQGARPGSVPGSGRVDGDGRPGRGRARTPERARRSPSM